MHHWHHLHFLAGIFPELCRYVAGTSAGIFVVDVVAVAVDVRDWSPRTRPSSSPSNAAKFSNLNILTFLGAGFVAKPTPLLDNLDYLDNQFVIFTFDNLALPSNL